MSLLEMFQDRIAGVSESGMELRVVVEAVRRVLAVVPEDDDVVRQQRNRRNELREGGAEIAVSDIHSRDDTEEEEEERDGETKATKNDAAAEAVESHAQLPSADVLNNSSSSSKSSSSSSSSSFVSPTSIGSTQAFLLEDDEKAGDEAEGGEEEEEEVDEARMRRYYEARTKLESTLQLRLFDSDPRQWLLSFICIATKLYSEEMDAYLEELQALLTFMARRRQRVEAQSAKLRARAQNTAAPGGENSVAEQDENDEEMSEAEAPRVTVNLPDHILRVKSTTLSSFFSLYVAVLMRHEAPVVILKRVCEEAIRLCDALRTSQRDPVDIATQVQIDRQAQGNAFLMQWLMDGEGRLAPIMLVPPAAKVEVAAPSSSDSNTVASSTEVDSDDVLDRSTSASISSALADVVVAAEAAAAIEAAAAAEDVEHAALSSEGDTTETALCPPVDAERAEALVSGYCNSRTPCSSELAMLVVKTVPGLLPTALLPCIEQPERVTFNGGYVRIASYMTPGETALITKWLQVQLTEAINEAGEDGETALVRAWASPTYDIRKGELTVLVNPSSAFRMQLSNPASFSLGGMQCDMCCLSGRRVSFQAVLDSGVRSEVLIGYDGCVGYDVCMACSYHYYKECEVRLLRAVHPNPSVRQSFAYGRFSKIVVQSVSVAAGEDGKTAVAEVVMGVSPFGVLPIGWVLPQDRVAELSRVCDLTEEYVELTEAEHAALPVPSPQWQDACTVTNVSKRVADGEAAEADLCPICLQLLHSPQPILRTQCGHWFHVECIGSHYHYMPAEVNGEVNESNGCPVCRHTPYMPSLTDIAETLRTNVYRLQVRVPVKAAPFAIAVGTILTNDGGYYNATNVAACCAYYDLAPGYAFTGAADGEEEEAAAAAGTACASAAPPVQPHAATEEE